MKKKEKEILQSAYKRWIDSRDTELYHVYKSHSSNKARAFDYCKHLCYEVMNGNNLRIISHNCNFFSVGFLYEDEDHETCFCYHTAFSTYGGKLEEIEA